MELTSEMSIIGENNEDDGIQYLAVYQSQIFFIYYFNSSIYSISVNNITGSIPIRKTLDYTVKSDFTVSVDFEEELLDCTKTPDDENCGKWNVLFAHSETVFGSLDGRAAALKKAKDIKKLPLEICEKYKGRLPNLKTLCNVINGVKYSLLSTIIVILLFVM